MTRQAVTALLTVRMATALEKECLSYDELVALSGLKKPTVARWIKALRDERVRGVYIERWLPACDGRLFVPCFRWGEQPDVPRPGRSREALERARKANVERMRAARAAKKGT